MHSHRCHAGRSAGSRLFRLGLLALSLPLLACGEKPRFERTISLLHAFPLAEVEIEPMGIDLKETEENLLEGWSPGGRLQDRAYTWGTGETSTLRFIVLQRRPVDLVLEGWPLLFPGADEQSVEVRLNGVHIGEFHFRPHRAPQLHRLSLPTDLLLDGENRIAFHYAYARRPTDVLPGNHDSRSLAVAWASIRLVRPDSVSEARLTTDSHPSPRVDRKSLIVPFGAAVTYYMLFPAGGAVTFDSVLPWRTSQARRDLGERPFLQVTVASTGSDEQRFTFPQSRTRRGEHSIPMPRSADPVRITFQSFAQGTVLHGQTGLAVLEPNVKVPASGPAQNGATREERPSFPTPPNVLVYLVDTLRADHLGTYGYSRPTSPHIDAFAEEATVFSLPLAQSSWTRPTVASLFTGLHPIAHGTNTRADALPSSLPTMAEHLGDLNYVTAGFTVNGNVSPEFGFARGFDSYELLSSSGGVQGENASSERVNSAAFRWLAERPGDKPFFLFLHTADPHGPYNPPQPYRNLFAATLQDQDIGKLPMLKQLKSQRSRDRDLAKSLIDLYDAEIAYNDHSFGQLLEELRRLGLYDSTMIIFLSDHGEEFLDHDGWGHGNSLYHEQLHVPLIIKYPWGYQSGTRVSQKVNQIDILPALLDYLGAPIPRDLHGSSFLLRDSDFTSEGLAIPSYAYLKLDRREIASVMSNGKKLIHYIHEPTALAHRFELFQFSADGRTSPEDVEIRSPLWAGYLQGLLRHHQTLMSPRDISPSHTDLSEEVRSNLRALGYL